LRLDRFLKISRLIKRRSLAKEACDYGVVKVNGAVAKASKEVNPGDILELDLAVWYKKVEVLEVPDRAVGKAMASNLYRVIEERRKEFEP
jgi:ribosomal 50S subunit-recycling heat shock protein